MTTLTDNDRRDLAAFTAPFRVDHTRDEYGDDHYSVVDWNEDAVPADYADKAAAQEHADRLNRFRFTPRIEAIRAEAQAVCPADCWVRMSDNLSHLGNGTFAVSIMRERETPVPEEDREPDTDVNDEYICGVTVGPSEPLDKIRTTLTRKLAEGVC